MMQSYSVLVFFFQIVVFCTVHIVVIFYNVITKQEKVFLRLTFFQGVSPTCVLHQALQRK